jgi:hypothetical protein
MSFQDVGKRGNSRSRQPVNATMGGGNNYSSSSSSGGGGHNGIPSSSSSSASSNSKSSPSSSSVFASMSIPAATVTTQISDSITQYHVRFILYFTFRYVTSRYVTFRHVTSRYVVF